MPAQAQEQKQSQKLDVASQGAQQQQQNKPTNNSDPSAKNEQMTGSSNGATPGAKGGSAEAQKYDQYVGMVKASGYQLDESVGNVNVIGIQGWLNGNVVENVKNKYNDSIICVYQQKDQAGNVTKKCAEFIASVDPGTYKKVNAKGSANLMYGQYTYQKGSHPYGKADANGKRKRYEAYNPVSQSHVWRDKNNDGVRASSDKDEKGYFGINIHAGGSKDGNVGNWSEGCQVIASKDGSVGVGNTEFQRFREIIRKQDADQKFVYTLLKGSDALDAYSKAEQNNPEPAAAEEPAPAVEEAAATAVEETAAPAAEAKDEKTNDIESAQEEKSSDDALTGMPTQSPLEELLAQNPEIKTNQQLINYFSKVAPKNYYQYASSKYGVNINDLLKNRQGSIDTSAANAVFVSKNTVFSFMVSNFGLNNAAACGVMGNIEIESNFNVNAVGDNGTSFGICQWHNERMTELKKFGGNDYKTIGVQLNFLASELNSKFSDLVTKLKAVPNTAEGAATAAYSWCVDFERPANKEAEGKRRGERAVEYFATYGNVAAKKADAGSATTNDVAESTSSLKVDPAAAKPEEQSKKDESVTIDIDVDKAVRINKSYGYSKELWKQIQTKVGLTGSDVDGLVGKITTNAIARWQATEGGFTGKDVDGMCGANTLEKMGLTSQATKQADQPKSSDASSANSDITAGQQASVDNSEIPNQSTVRNNNSIYGHVDSAGSMLTKVVPAYPMYYGSSTISGISVHKKVAARVQNIFSQTREAYTDQEIQELGLNLFSGCYNKRKTKGGSSYSIHSWGIAIDIDGARNPLKSNGKEPLASEKARKFWDIVEANGGHSLGREKGYDWMHFQFATFK